ncbi:MAG: hypothetical protein J0I06_04345 [Planctomycetes bacterium]|nr:hypothetical protein [Planctomycetota bacterium]
MRVLRWLALAVGSTALLASTGQGDQPPKAEKPDLIVADLALDGTDLVLEVQNQGPGAAKKGLTVEAEVSGSVYKKVKDKATGKDKTVSEPVSVTVKVPVPAAVMATEKVKVPLDKLGVKELKDFSPMVTVKLDTKKALDEERKNNTYHRQLDLIGNQVPAPRGDYRAGTELPDLVITDVTQDSVYLVVHYKNAGKGVTGADFLISFRSGKAKFDGNSYYRFRVPAAGTETKSGGLSYTLIGLKKGDEAEVEVTIDWEDRVRETDKKNNTFKKKIVIK